MKITENMVKETMVEFYDVFNDNDSGSNYNSYVSITEWSNAEGFDVSIDAGKEKRLSLTYNEALALVTAFEKMEVIPDNTEDEYYPYDEDEDCYDGPGGGATCRDFLFGRPTGL